MLKIVIDATGARVFYNGNPAIYYDPDNQKHTDDLAYLCKRELWGSGGHW